MSYIATGMTEDEHRDESIAIQREFLALRKRELDQRDRSRLWQALTMVATVGIPLVTFFGLKSWFELKGK